MIVHCAAIALVLCSIISLFGICGAAQAETSDTPSPRIVSYNLSYAEYIYILFAVDTDGVAPGDVELLLWDGEPESVTSKPDFVDTACEVAYDSMGAPVYDCVFRSPGIAAKDSCDYIYAAAHIKGTDIYSGIVRYSAVEYLYERKITPNITPVQNRAYDAMLEYAEAIQLLLDPTNENLPSDYRYVAVSGGKIDGKFNTGLHKPGETVTISLNSRSGSFIGWTNSNGDIVSKDASFELSVGEEHIKLYAQYDDGTPRPYSAELTKLENGVKKYFVGWEDAAGNIVSTLAHTQLSGLYEAKYLSLDDIESSDLSDFSSELDGFALFNKNNKEYSGDADFIIAQIPSIDGFNNNALGYSSYRDTGTKAEESYAIKALPVGLSHSSVRISFDIGLTSAEFGSHSHSNYFSMTGSDELYRISVLSGNEIMIKLNLVAVEDGNKVVGFNLKVEGSDDYILDERIGIEEVCSLAFELASDDDGKTVSGCNLYRGGKYLYSFDLGESGIAYPSDTLKLSFGTTEQTRSTIYIDDVLCLGLD